MTMIYLALYKGRKTLRRPFDLIARTSDALTRALTRGAYSHCEIALLSGSPNGGAEGGTGYLKGTESADNGRLYRCYSASIRDGGVRCKTMPLPSDKWDLLPLGDSPKLHDALNAHFAATCGQAYDWTGALGVVLRTAHKRDRWFCSEWCGHVLGLPESWRFSPNDLAAVVRCNADWGG